MYAPSEGSVRVSADPAQRWRFRISGAQRNLSLFPLLLLPLFVAESRHGGDGWGEMMLYVGLEAPQDIIDDLAAALDCMNRQGYIAS